MIHPQNISIEDYSYDLPDERIAKFPLEQRDSSKLLVYKQGEIGKMYSATSATTCPKTC